MQQNYDIMYLLNFSSYNNFYNFRLFSNFKKLFSYYVLEREYYSRNLTGKLNNFISRTNSY